MCLHNKLVCGLLEYQWGKAGNTHISYSRIENGDRALRSMDVCYKDTSLWEVGYDTKIL